MKKEKIKTIGKKGKRNPNKRKDKRKYIPMNTWTN